MTSKQHKDTFEETHKSVHEGIEYPCTHCENKAKRRDHIQKHLQMVHDGIDIFVLIVITKLQQSTI